MFRLQSSHLQAITIIHTGKVEVMRIIIIIIIIIIMSSTFVRELL